VTGRQLEGLRREELCEKFVNDYDFVFWQVEPDCFELVQAHWDEALQLWKTKDGNELKEALLQGPWKDKEIRRFYLQLQIWGTS